MSTTDTDALKERIARALYVEACEEEDGGLTWETEDSVAEEIEGWERFAAAVLPIVAVEARKAKAEALRDAKGRVYASSWWADGADNYADRVRGFLGTLATEYETGDNDEH